MNCVYPMMEAVRNDAVHSAESIHTTLPCMNNHHVDQLSKEKEEELLYGAGDEGDDEDTLSDDSMRLKLSDDETEVEDTIMSVQVVGRESTVEVNETKLKPAETANGTSSVESEKLKETKKEEFKAGQRKEHSSGNVSMDEKKIINNEGKHKKFSAKGNMKSTIASGPSGRWPVYNNQWKSMNYSHANSYRNTNCFPYPRYAHPMPIEHDRYDQYNYCSRFDNRYPWFQQGRNNGNRTVPLYPVHAQQQYIPRRHKNNRGKPNFPNNKNVAKANLANKLREGPLPSGNNSSIVTSESCTENNDRECTKGIVTKQLESLQELEKKGAVKPEGNLCSVNEFIDTGTVESNLETNSMDVTCETKFAEERNEGRKDSELDNGAESKDPAVIEVSTSTEDACEKPVHSLLNSELNDNSKQEQAEITVIPNDSDAHTTTNSLRVESSPMDSGETGQIVNKTTEVEGDINNQNNSRESEKTSTTCGKESTVASGEGCLVSDIQKIDSIINEVKDAKQSDVNNHVPQEMEHIESPVDSTITELAINSNSASPKNEHEHLKKEVAESNNDSKEHIPSNGVASIVTSSQNGDDIECKLENDVVSTEEESIKKEKSIDNATYGNQRLSLTDDTKGSSKICKADSSVGEPLTNNVLEELYNVIYEETTKTNENKDKAVSVADVEDKQSCSGENAILTKNEFTVKSENEEAQDPSEDSKGNIKLSSIEKTENAERSASDVLTDKIIECLSDAKTDTAGPVRRQKRGRPKKRKPELSQEETKVNDTGRQKRQTAKNAEEIIRKKFLNNDSDMETSDDSEKSATTNHKVNPESHGSAPGSVKRTYPENDTTKYNGNLKKQKVISESLSEQMTGKKNNTTNVSNLNYVYKFFQRDLKEKLPKLTQEELEELLIQKIVETITMQGEIGRLREQARISQRNQEATRAKCQQLAKQIKDFEMVLGRYAADRRTTTDKPVTPIKINRSVGLQVNFAPEQVMQNLRQLQHSPANASTTPNETGSNSVSPRRGIKIRPPRRLDGPALVQPAVPPQNHVQPAQVLPTVPPTALLVPKAVEPQHSVQIPTQTNKVPVITNPQTIHPVQQQVQVQQVQAQVQPQAIVLNGKVPIQASRSEIIQAASKPRKNDLIDLTDEEEKNKAVKIPTIATVSDQITLAPKPQPCFQRVLPAIPANIAVAGQTASIRVVQPASQPTPTALVNNLNTPRLAYVMQSGDGSTRQLLITSNSNTIRPVSSPGRPATFPTLTYKTGISSIANGTVRVLTTAATPTVQLNQHPAPLPDPPTYAVNPALKLPPPAPSLKISKVATAGATGIVLSWNMTLSDKYADIVSYQLYAYQEVAGVPANTALWKKVGDVRALPLPMACTLTQFSKGNNYHFAVRAVDTHSRKGQYSTPGNISL